MYKAADLKNVFAFVLPVIAGQAFTVLLKTVIHLLILHGSSPTFKTVWEQWLEWEALISAASGDAGCASMPT